MPGSGSTHSQLKFNKASSGNSNVHSVQYVQSYYLDHCRSISCSQLFSVGPPPLFGPPRAPAMSDRKPEQKRGKTPHRRHVVTHVVTCCNGNSTVQSCPTWNGSTAQLRSTSRLEVQVEVQLNSHVSGKRVPGSPVPSEDFGRAGCGVAVMTKALKNAGLLDSITWSRDSRNTRAVCKLHELSDNVSTACAQRLRTRRTMLRHCGVNGLRRKSRQEQPRSPSQSSAPPAPEELCPQHCEVCAKSVQSVQSLQSGE